MENNIKNININSNNITNKDDLNLPANKEIFIKNNTDNNEINIDNKDNKHPTRSESIFSKTKAKYKQRYEVINDQLKEYDKRSEILSEIISKFIKANCLDYYNQFVELEKMNNEREYRDQQDNSDLFNQYYKCQRYYGHNITDFLKYNRDILDKISEKFSSEIFTCDYTYHKDNDLIVCYNKAIENHLKQSSNLLNQAIPILKKKEEYMKLVKEKEGLL